MRTSSLCLYCILLVVLIEGEGNRVGYSVSIRDAWPGRQYFKNKLNPQYYGNREIVGGKYVKSITKHPYMAFLFREDGSFMGGCGATILTTKHLLTAAHCLTNCSIVLDKNFKLGDYVKTICKNTLIEDYTVLVGSTEPIRALEKREIYQWFIHPDYDAYDREKKCVENYDIAIVELKTALTIRDEISFVTLPPPGFKTTVHMKCQVLGWGDTQDRWNFTLENLHLKIATVHFINNRQCINHKKILFEKYFDGTEEQKKNFLGFFSDYSFCKDTKICSMDKKKGTCEGDSGGPMICNGVQVGVTSTGAKIHGHCVGSHQIHSYTRVDMFLNWINDIIY